MINGLPEEEYFVSGHSACPGCGAAIIMRIITKAAGKNTILVHNTGCMEVVSTKFPTTAWKLPWVHGAFENGAAIASGIHAGLKAQGKREDYNILVIGGDGSTFDIGFGALSGAIDRGDKFTYVCYDNEAYANTGLQKSGATPLYAWTATTPIGKLIRGNMRDKKPIVDIIAAHKVEYVATATIAYPHDLFNKVKKALLHDGVSFIHVLSPCILGWKYDSNKTIELSRLAVDTGMFYLYEIEKGKFKLSITPKMEPVEKYLKAQGRFAHLTNQEIEEIQKIVNENWEELKKKINSN